MDGTSTSVWSGSYGTPDRYKEVSVMRIQSFAISTRRVIATFVFLASLVLATQAVSAQQGTATPLDTEGGTAAHPAHIHNGTCENLGDVVYPLADVAPLSAGATPAASPAAMDMGSASDQVVVAESTTILEVSLDEILGGEHAINVHESADNIQNYIACGNLTGEPENGHLRVDMHELNDSGLEGLAMLTANPDGTTTVTVTLFEVNSGMTGTPEATPAS